MSHLMNTYARLPVAFSHGSGSRVTDTEGKTYLDGLSGIAVNTLGHNHPALVAAISAQAGRLLHAEHVAHGRGSGDNLPTVFSDVEGSYQSSLGLFATAETYTGQNGYSLRMDGLEPGINGRARERLIVMHGADYVDPAQARRQGRLGRSWGCPAVRDEVAQAVIDDLKDGQLLFAYANDPAWRRDSTLLRCPSR